MDPPNPPIYDPAKPGNLNIFALRYQETCLHNASTEQLIRELIQYGNSVESHFNGEVDALKKKLHDLQLDLNSSERTRRDIVQKLKDMETKLGYIPDRNPYIVVLIDGDGLIFKDSFVKKGIEGGKLAANELLKTINEKLSATETTPVTVFVNVFANVAGLGKAMMRDDCVADSTALHNFVLGFNQANVSSNFVDVGYGKELADAKILDSLRFHLRNFNCKKAVLGVSHDAGYAPFLANMCTDDTKDRMAILEGTPTVVELSTLGLQIFNAPRLFRHEKLSAKPQEPSRQPSPVPAPLPLPLLPLPSPSPLPLPSPSPSVVPVTTTWAAVARTPASPPPKVTLPVPFKTGTPSRVKQSSPPPWNPGPRGFDPVIKINLTVLERLRKRKDKNRLCNNHFLRGPCTRGKECNFTHNYSPTDEEKKAIAWFARTNRCAAGQNCTNSDCIYGHHCPCLNNGVCMHPRCKFYINEHPPGTTFRGPRPKENADEHDADDEEDDDW
ncbi:hypothetical protein F5Y11DRAFT_328357 [Daldinia sp. FL1419]|nr:hypothetical protein F5Y11DRAFT_328357 [Daldinia sp. FL1419]